jgi:hypothetical protein
MTLPAFLFGIIISTLIGALFHMWRGGRLWRLVLYLILSWIGFWCGHFLGEKIQWTFWSIGPLRLGMAIFGSFIVLGVGYWLSLISKDVDNSAENTR